MCAASPAPRRWRPSLGRRPWRAPAIPPRLRRLRPPPPRRPGGRRRRSTWSSRRRWRPARRRSCRRARRRRHRARARTARARSRSVPGSTPSRRATTRPASAAAASSRASAASACAWRRRSSSAKRALPLDQALDRLGELVGRRCAASPPRPPPTEVSRRIWAYEPVPVVASIRRVFAPIELSETMRNGPIVPSAGTWVPPHSSTDSGPARTTRTRLAVLLAEEGDRARRLGLGPRGSRRRCDRRVGEDRRRDQVLDRRELVRRDGGEVAEVEPQPVGRDERALLAHVLAEGRPQRPVEKVGRRVVAADRLARAPRRSPPSTSAPGATTPETT